MKTTVKFLFSTLVAAAAMTSTAWAEGTTLPELKVADFSNITDAIKAAEAFGGAVVDLGSTGFSGKELGETVANGLFGVNGTYTFVGGNYADFVYVDTPRSGEVDVDIVFDGAKVVVNKFRLANGASLLIKDSHADSNNVTSRGWTTFYGDSSISIENSVVGWDIYDKGNSDRIVAGDKTTVYAGSGEQAGAMVFAGSGVMNVKGSTIFAFTSEDFLYSAFTVYDKGLMAFENSSVYGHTLRIGSSNDNKTVGRDNEIATMVFDNSVLRGINGDGAASIVVGDGSATAGKLIVKNDSVIDRADATMTVNGNGYVDVDNSVVRVGAINNQNVIKVNDSTLSFVTMNTPGTAQLFVTGESSITGKTVTGGTKLRIGQADTNGDGIADSKPLGNKLTLGVDSMTVNFANIYNTAITLSKDTAITTTGKDGAGNQVNSSYIYAENSSFDLNEKTLTIGGGFMLSGVTFSNGDVVFDGALGTTHKNMVFQDYTNTIASDATITVKTGDANIYEDLNVYGAFVDERASGNQINVGLTSEYYKTGEDDVADYTNGANLLVAGSGALFKTNRDVFIHTADEAYGVEESSLTVSDGATLDIGGTITNNSKIVVSNSTLRAGNIVNNGTIYVEGDGVTSWDSNVTGSGAIYVGKDSVTGKDNLGSTLEIVGDKSIGGTKLYVDDGAVLKIGEGDSLSFTAKSGGDDYKFLVIGGNLDVAGDLTVDGCSIRFSRAKNTTISGTANFDGQTCIYGSNVTVTGELNITHGQNMGDSLIIGYSKASSIGNIDTTANLVVSGANAKVTVNGGDWKSAAVTKIYTDENGKVGSLIVEDGATFETDGSIESSGIISVDNGSLSAAGTIINNYYLLVQNGGRLSANKIVNNYSFDIYNSTLENQTISGSGYVYAENALLNNISVSGNTVYMMGTNVNGGTFATVYNGYGVVNGEWQTAGDTESVISGNVVAGSWYDYGKTTVASGATVTATNFYAQGTNGATIDGTVEVSGIFRGYNGTISESGKVVAGTAVHLYGNTTNQREYNIKGELIASNDGNHGSVFEVGSAYVKQYYGDNGEYWSIGGANTVVNVSGSVTLKAGEYGAANARVNVDEEGYKATLNITDGGSVVVEGTLTNNGFINVDGGTLTAVTIVNNGSITLNNATFNVTNLTGTGTLTMLGKSEVKDESGSAGVEVESIVVKTESNAVALSSSVNTIVFGGVQEVTETANTEITTLAANESVVIAWHFDVSGIESGESVTIETTIKTGLNDSEIKIFHKGDEDGAEWTEANVSDVNYDATTGKLSFKANSFSSYAVAVPEPSMFGLFAGLGALLLVGTRRRRR